MGKRLLVSSAAFVFAFGILFASILQSSSVHYAFSQSPNDIPANVPDIDYHLPGTGVVGPDDPLWLLEVLRDKVWLTTTLNENEKSEILLLLADKRIAYAEQLAHRGEFEESLSVARKAEMYLNSSYSFLTKIEKSDNSFNRLCNKLASSSLKHRQVLEEIYSIAPDDARPLISSITDTPKNIYEYTVHMMNESGISPVTNPFNN